jgi:hypothetical protein
MEIKKQGSSFNEVPYDAVEDPPSSELYDIMQEETELPSKFPLNRKNIAIISVCGLAVIITAAFFYFKPALFLAETAEEEIIIEDEAWGDYEEELPQPFAYTVYEADLLRAVGYTAREIEGFELEEIVDIQPLLDKQIKARQEEFLDIYRAFLREAKESGNEQYNYVLSNSYLGLPPQEFIEEDEKRDYVTYTELVNYWKMPMQGWQPTIKVRLANDAVIYMHITPSRYEELKDSGNMHIRYDYIYYKGVKSVTNVTEIVH